MGVVKSSMFFSLGTMCSRVTGLLREAVLSYSFGASPLFDAFIIAFRLPNLLRDMLAEGALSQAFTKVYSEVRQKSADRGLDLLIASTKFFFLTSLVIAIMGIFFAEELVTLFTLLAGEETQKNLVADSALLARIVFPYLILAVISAIFMGTLHQENKFFQSAFAPVMLNLGFIGGALGLARLFPQLDFLPIPQHLKAISGLATGVLLGGSLHCFFLFRAISSRFSLRKIISARSPDLKNVIILMLPMTVAYSTAPINAFINTNFAASLAPGTVSWLYYAFRLFHLPVGLFGVAVGVAILPTLVRKLQGVFTPETSLLFWQAIDLVLWLMSICFVFVLVNYFYLTQFIYQQGSFTHQDSHNTGLALLMYSFGIIGYGLLKVFTSVYYAVNRTTFAMKVSFVMIAINIGANSLLVETLGFRGLALTSSIVVSVNVLILALGLRKEKINWQRQKIMRSLGFLTLLSLLGFSGQKLVLFYLAEMNFSSLKIKALVILGSNGILLSLIALLLGFLYLRRNPLRLAR